MNDQLTKQLTAVIMAHGLALAANAQTTPGTPAGGTNAPSKLPDIVVKGEQEQAEPYKPGNLQSPRYTEPLRDVPQTVTVVPRAVIEQQNATTLRDVLRNVPGISYQAGEGGVPAGDNLSIRGFNARTDLFVDNVRDFGGYSRDSFNIEQVEVSKGPASSYAGRGSTGGSVNLVSKAPHIGSILRRSFGFGTEDYKRLTLDLNQPIAKSPVAGTAVRLNGMWNESGVAGRDVVEQQALGRGSVRRVRTRHADARDAELFPSRARTTFPTTAFPGCLRTPTPRCAVTATRRRPWISDTFYGLKSQGL